MVTLRSALLWAVFGNVLPCAPQQAATTAGASCAPMMDPLDGDETVCGKPDEELLGSVPMRGMHVMRVMPCSALPHTGEASCPLFELEVFVDSVREMRLPHAVTVNCSDHELLHLVLALKAVVQPMRNNHSDIPPQGSVARFELELRTGFDRWAFYTPHGERIRTMAGLLRCGRILAVEGGLFVWPGVRLGFRRPVHLLGDETFQQVMLITQSLQPLVFLVDPLLSDAECAHIINVTEPTLVASHVSHFDYDIGKASTQWRRSLQARLATDVDLTVVSMSKRASAVLKLPWKHGEPLQVVRYDAQNGSTPGGKYDAHSDYFDPELYKTQPHMIEMIDGDGSRNRHATLLWYMTDVHHGGETFFPRSGALGHPPDPRCEDEAGLQGMKVTPSKGKALLFYSLRPDGAVDPFSLHGGCPVGEGGVKRVVNQWFWSKPYRP